MVNQGDERWHAKRKLKIKLGGISVWWIVGDLCISRYHHNYFPITFPIEVPPLHILCIQI